jgi:hypothetical protein
MMGRHKGFPPEIITDLVGDVFQARAAELGEEEGSARITVMMLLH